MFVIHRPVYRILRQKAERETETEALSISSAPEMTVDTQTEISTTQPKIPSPDTAISVPSPPQATPGNTGPERTLTYSCGPRPYRPPNRPDAPSSRPTLPPQSEDISHPSKPVPRLPNPNIPERERLSPKPQRNSITPLSNICTSL